MEIYQLVIIDKLYNKFGLSPTKLWDIKSNLIVIQRVPKDKSKLIISDLIDSGYLIKTSEAEYKLRDNIKTDIDKAIEKYNIIRNRTFLK